ncbi:MAG: hypothetical protein WC045_03270 [Patescibacteria group bacterium]
MANKKFLEEYPLYKKYETAWNQEEHDYSWMTLGKLPEPAIHMYCTVCDSDQTFNMRNEYYDDSYMGLERNNTEFQKYAEEVKLVYCEKIPAAGKVLRSDYLCSACGKGRMIFLIYFFREKIGSRSVLCMMKVGQTPPWSIVVNKEMEKLLGSNAEHYKKGLICESQSYGIGAYAYFRRITETIIDELLDSISDLLEGKEKELYADALAKTKATRVTQDKIDLVKHLLPVSLRPDGLNPLDILHSALSQGLHVEDDEVCLEQAEAIKKVLVFLVSQIIKKKDEAKEFTKGMREILNKKSKPTVVEDGKEKKADESE